ncbi:MAG: hypothetical protein KIT34_09385 [Cyanobacteria bacterium TGS_CYA1]|nr:hypothetical protein [Cyanobacteria bacterium TGS_CYA1]
MKYLTIALALGAIACNLFFAAPAEARHRHGCHQRFWNNGYGNGNGNWNNGWGRGGCRRQNNWQRGWGNNHGRYRSGLMRNMFRFY